MEGRPHRQDRLAGEHRRDKTAAGGDQRLHLHLLFVVEEAAGGQESADLAVEIAFHPVTAPPGQIGAAFDLVAHKPVGVLDPLRGLGGTDDKALFGQALDQPLQGDGVVAHVDLADQRELGELGMGGPQADLAQSRRCGLQLAHHDRPA